MNPGHTEPGLQAGWRLLRFWFRLEGAPNLPTRRLRAAEKAAMLRADKVIPAGQWSGAPADTVVLDFDERYRRRVAMTGVARARIPARPAGSGDAARGRRAPPRGRAYCRSGRRARAPGGDPGRGPRGARSHRLASRQPPPAGRNPAKSPAHPPRSGDRGHGRGPRGRVIALQAPFNPEGGAYVGAGAPERHGHDHGHGAAHGRDHAHDHAHEHGHGPRG